MKSVIVIFLTFLAIFLRTSLLHADLRANFQLNYLSEGSLLGEASFELEREGIYEFSLAGIKLREIYLDGEVPRYELRGEKLRIYNPRKNSKFVISFEKELTIKGHLSVQIEENYIPWPNEPVIFEITFKGFPENKGSILIPSEEEERTKDLLIFKMSRPITAPSPLIFGRFKVYCFEVLGRQICYISSRKVEQSELKSFERALNEDLIKLNEQERTIFLPYQRFYFLGHKENIIYPLLITLIGDLRTKDQSKVFLRSAFKHSLLYSLGFKHEMLIEALTTFFSDYKFAGNRTQFRKEILLNRTPKEASFSLLYEAIGKTKEEEFISLVRDFLLRNLYSGTRDARFFKFINDKFGRNLEEIFQQERTCPLKVKPIAWSRPLGRDDLYQIDLTVSVDDDCFRANSLRVRTITSQGTAEHVFFWDSRRKTFTYRVRGNPLYLMIDPDYEIYRNLHFEEKSPPKEAVFRNGGIIYLPRQDLYPTYRELIQILLERGYILRYGLPKISELPAQNAIFLDSPPSYFHLEYPKEGFFFYFFPHPEDPSSHIAFIRASTSGELKDALKNAEKWKVARLVHLRRGKILTLNEFKDSQGININLSARLYAQGVRLANLMTPDKLAKELLPHQIILIGEQHDRYSHHLFQLELIKQLTSLYPKLAIGLEMFQRPFQKYLDDFIEGKIGELELLEKTEYFERWGYDWRLYRDIILFAKENKVKLIALDLPQELVKKVFRSGLQSLSKEEKIQLPEIDLHNPLYENYLRHIFSLHHFSKETNFEFFYQAQVLRDEGMAERILEFIRTHPDHKMVVLVGGGHLRDGLGIPHSLRRRNFTNFRTIYLGVVETLTPSLADYWFIPQEIPFEKTPTLGVTFDESETGLIIKYVSENSPAQKAGLRVGDKLVKVDNTILRKVSQLKLVLTFKKRGDKLKLFLEREGKILETEVILE